MTGLGPVTHGCPCISKDVGAPPKSGRDTGSDQPVFHGVMTGLGPVTHECPCIIKDVDGRPKSGHDTGSDQPVFSWCQGRP
jgi:hypothetical protein